MCQIKTLHPAHLSTFLGGGYIEFGSLLEGLPQHLSDEGLSGNLQGYHVAGTFQHSFWRRELAMGKTWQLQDDSVWPSGPSSCQLLVACLPANVILGQLQRLCRELLCLMPLVAVPEVFPELLRSKPELFGQTI